MTAVWVNFCVAILIWMMGEKGEHFLHSMLCYFKKGKNAKKDMCSNMEKVLRLIECVKSGLQSFALEISHWTMLPGPVDQSS